MKAGKRQSLHDVHVAVVYVRSSLTVHNPLFFVHKV